MSKKTLLPFLYFTAALSWLGLPTATAQTAADILRETGVQGGIVIHLGCGNGGLTAALRANDRYTVHGLETDAATVARAREHIRGRGLYGPVSVEVFGGKTLPYADNLANLVVVQNDLGVPESEILRVLPPRGIAYVKDGDKWRKTVKPVPATIDEWPHFLHDAGNNAVANDSLVGPPRHLQWVAAPLWLRSHETPSGFEALVSAGGRVFYLLDEGLIGITDQRMPERWAILCRDAYNGKLLWRRPIGPWGWTEWARDRFQDKDWTTITGGRTVVPDENQRRLVADGNRLYATLGYLAPLSILDAATGEVLATVKDTMPARQILADDGMVVVLVAETPAAARQKAKKGKGAETSQATLVAVDGQAGKVLWKKEVEGVAGLLLALDHGRVIHQSGTTLTALDAKTGEKLWTVQAEGPRATTLVAHDQVVLLRSAKNLAAHDARQGKPLWQKEVLPSIGIGTHDLFVVDGVVWPGMSAVKEDLPPSGKSPHTLAIGYDLRTGAEKKRVQAQNLLSPEHHHRCYRNKATARYLIGAMEGSEFLDLQSDGHAQNNWLRGACKYGIMPCNGLLYVPPDQCFCDPGAKVLGFTAVAADSASDASAVPDAARLEKGPAYSTAADIKSVAFDPEDWPTFRHDAARHGTTPTAVDGKLEPAWRIKLGGGLTAPVAVGNRVYVAARDAHTVHALDAADGREIWRFVAGGRVDSPPTVFGGMVYFGSADGRVYCLRASDGVLAWRFLAAPRDRRVAAFDQLESAWPVHGSVLIRDGLVYCTAGRSSYLDDGIQVWALQALTGQIAHRATIEGPFPDVKSNRDVSFHIPGANSDILVSEGDSLYMRQKRLTLDLKEVKADVLSTKGEADVGLHVFATSGFLDSSWYNRTFWMYAKRWPGFQLANQAPKTGQLLVVDNEATYSVRVFYRRNVHSPMFFPGKEGYLLFADRNTNEPQIVGEEGARKPLEWLPQSGYARREGERKLDSPAFGLDKMIGYTRADPPLWTNWLSIRIRAMVKAGDTILVAGPPDVFDPDDPYGAFEGRKAARLALVSAADGRKLMERELETPPIFDGLIAARGRVFMSLEDDSLACWTGSQ